MSPIFQFLLLLAAFVCFILAAFGVRARWAARVNLIALGLALWVLIFLIEALLAVA